MLYLANLIRYPYTGTLQYQDNESTNFSAKFQQNKTYSWNYKRALNEFCCDKLLKFEERYMKLFLGGIIDIPDKMYLKFLFDIRVRFSNGTDFSLGECKVLCTENHNIINEKINIDSIIKRFNFNPYHDTVYINMTVKDNGNENNTDPIKIKFETFGFNLLSFR